jgi:predicted dehydrogenase
MPGVHAHSETLKCEIVAVADPWKTRRNEAAKQVEQWYGRSPRAFVSYRDLLAVPEVDAVMIASCDHQHTAHLQATAEAGKDVYCEKPLGMDLDKVKRACDAVQAAGVVCQIGTQIRSLPTSTTCRQLVQDGKLGKISRIEQVRNGIRPYWYSRIADVKESDVDWKEFLMDRPQRPFRADHFSGWYGVRDFSDGPVPGLGSHFVDLIHYITGAEFPESVVAQAGTFTFIDQHEFTCPDQVQAVWTYPDGFMVSYCTNFGNSNGNRIHFYGEHGTLDMTPWTRPKVSSAGRRTQGELAEETLVPPTETPDHFLDWLQCIRSRGQCRAPIEAGYQHAVAVLMAVQAHDTGLRQVYDRQKREIRAG